MKIEEIRKMKPEETDKNLSEFRLELAKELGNVRMGRAVKNPGRIRELRRSIARVLTVQKESKTKVESKQQIKQATKKEK